VDTQDPPIRAAVETLAPTTGLWHLVEMGNALQQDKQQQLVALEAHGPSPPVLQRLREHEAKHGVVSLQLSS
jgi:hypothetical protein